MTPHCPECGFVNAPDAPWCVSCRVRLGQERERAAMCRGCQKAETWRRDGYCDDCSENEDAIGERMRDFDAWMCEHRDTVEAIELG